MVPASSKSLSFRWLNSFAIPTALLLVALSMGLNHEDDQLVTVLPIHYSNALDGNIHLHQFPLLTRPLQVPPSASASGKRIRARLKPGVRRLEIHVPVDTRPEVWNTERSKELGTARDVDDREKNQPSVPKGKQREGEGPRLSEIRMRSEPVPQTGAYVLGVVREGQHWEKMIPSLLFILILADREASLAPNQRDASVEANFDLHRRLKS